MMLSLFKPSFDKLRQLVLKDDDESLYGYAQKHKGVLGATNSFGVTLLMVALREKKYDAAEVIIISGADTNVMASVNEAERTAWDYAAREEETPRKIFELLLEVGTSVVTPHYFLPVSYPLMRKDFNLAQLFVDNGARMNNLLVTATAEQAYDEALFLIRNKANLDERDSDGCTPLMLAIQASRFELVKLLVDSGADATLKDNKGKSTLHYTEGKGVEIVDLIFTASLAA